MAELTDTFWEEEALALSLVLLPVLRKSAIAAIPAALLLLNELTADPVSVDRASLEDELAAWAAGAAIIAALLMTRTTRRAVEGWQVEPGDTRPALRALLAEILGSDRAELAAITEITRSFAEGYMKTWNKSGVVTGIQWFTAADERVCSVCGPLHGEKGTMEGGVSGMFPPAHQRCRCYLLPVIG